jgi:hypothetical protein
MSARSFRPELAHLVVAGAVTASLGAACSKKPAPKAEADPSKVTALAKVLLDNTPAPAAVKQCTPADFAGAASLTQRTVLLLAKEQLSTEPTRADWTNPTELDHPAARVLLDPKADPTAQRQAAAEMLAAKAYVVYRVDMVNAPIALGVKELKRGALGMRAIGYDKKGAPSCVSVFVVQNDKEKSEWAMDKSDRAQIDPAIAKAMRDDLREQLLKKAVEMGTTLPTAPPVTP